MLTKGTGAPHEVVGPGPALNVVLWSVTIWRVKSYSWSWLPVKYRVSYRLAVLVFLCCRNRAPLHLSSALSDSAARSRRPNLRSSNTGIVIQPRTRHPTLGGRSFQVAASRVWNSLPVSLRVSDNVNDFKRQLKAYLLSISFMWPFICIFSF